MATISAHTITSLLAAVIVPVLQLAILARLCDRDAGMNNRFVLRSGRGGCVLVVLPLNERYQRKHECVFVVQGSRDQAF